MPILHVQWKVQPLFAPQPRLNCNGCGGVRPFKTSNKVRLNANGKRLDAWLIYRCTHCDNTWNRPIFERRNLQDIDPAMLQALQNNDNDWVSAFAFDLGQLRRETKQIDEFPDIAIRKLILSRTDSSSNQLLLDLKISFATSLRVDRLLSSELGLSRARIRRLETQGCFSANGHRLGLRRPIKDDMVIRLDLSNETDDLAIMIAAGAGNE